MSQNYMTIPFQPNLDFTISLFDTELDKKTGFAVIVVLTFSKVDRNQNENTKQKNWDDFRRLPFSDRNRNRRTLKVCFSLRISQNYIHPQIFV